MIMFLLQVMVLRWLARHGLRLLRCLIAVPVMIAAAPVTTVVAVAVLVAWLRGWLPARLRRAAALSLPMTITYLITQAVTTRSWQAVLAAPYLGWRAGWHALAIGDTC